VKIGAKIARWRDTLRGCSHKIEGLSADMMFADTETQPLADMAMIGDELMRIANEMDEAIAAAKPARSLPSILNEGIL